MPNAITPKIQADLYAETDIRFWAQTGYRPGVKLNPKDPKDAQFLPVWLDIYKKVRAAWLAGTLEWTFDAPPVTQAIADAQHASAVTASTMAQLTTAASPADVAAHAAVAQANHETAQAATKVAASYQPPTVDPALVAHAAQGAQAAAVQHGAVGEPHDAHVVATMQASSAPRHATDVATGANPPTASSPSGVPPAAATPMPDAPPGAADDRAGGGWTTKQKVIAGGVALVGASLLAIAAGGSSKPKRRAHGKLLYARYSGR